MGTPIAKPNSAPDPADQPADHLHKWVMLATFSVTEQQVEQMAAARVDPSGEGRAPVNLSQEDMLSLDGPGCSRCGDEWTVAYGQPCPGSPFAVGAQEALPDHLLVPKDSGLLLPNGQSASGVGNGLLLPRQPE